jgi:hypothetical protein
MEEKGNLSLRSVLASRMVEKILFGYPTRYLRTIERTSLQCGCASLNFQSQLPI